MSKLSTFRRLSAYEKRTLIMTIFLLPALKVAIHVWSYQRIRAVLLRTSQQREQKEESSKVVGETVRIVGRVSRYDVMRATCLTRSMALWWLLRRQGVESEIRFGVRRGGDGIQAHAWVEQGRLVLNDRADIRDIYAAFEFEAGVNGLEWR